MSEGGAPASPGLPPRYEVQKFLGQGAMGRVYLCRDAELDVLVAIKVLAPQYAEDPTSVDQVRTEARAVAKLRGCPTILSLYGFEQHQGTWYLVTEFAAGGALDTRLKREGRLTEEECRRIGAEVAEALQYAHKSLVLHRDIKPGNILIDEKGGVKVADFGIAKVLRSDNAQVSTMTLTGTPMYMSPEAILREPMDARSDLYSLGCMLFEMATGKRPFSGSHFEIFLAKTAEGAVPPDPKPLAPHLSDAFCALVRKCMATKPDGRHPDGTALAAELRSVTRAEEEAHLATLTTRGKAGEGLPGFPAPSSADGATVRELPPSAPTRPQEATVREPPPAAAAPSSAAPPAKKLPLVPVVAGVVALVALGGWLAFGRGGDEPPPKATDEPKSSPKDPGVSDPEDAPKPPAPDRPDEGGTKSPSPPPGDGGKAETAPPQPPAPAPPPPPPTAPPRDAGIQPLVELPPPAGKPVVPDAADLPKGFVLQGGRIWCATDRVEMVFVPAGVFPRGADELELESNEPRDVTPRRQVFVSAFLLDRHEVTVAQWKAYCAATGTPLPADLPANERLPITGVFHDEATAYALWAGKRLPTEAEWEKAARGSEGRKWPWGNERVAYAFNGRRGDDGFNSAAPVGSHPKDESPYGARDMAGNVSEWCADWYDEGVYRREDSLRDPTGPTVEPKDGQRCLRGGNWDPAALDELAISYSRNFDPEKARKRFIGFRCAVTVPAK